MAEDEMKNTFGCSFVVEMTSGVCRVSKKLK